MNSLLLSKNHHFVSSAPIIRELVDQPFQKFQMNIFVYVKYYSDGSCILLSSNEEWMQYHLAMEYPVPAPIPLHLLQRPESFHLVPDDGLFKAAKYDLIQKYGSDKAVDFIVRGKDFHEIICFAFPQDHPDAMNTILNNLDAFKEFTALFRHKASKLLESSENHKIVLPQHMAGITPDVVFPVSGHDTHYAARDQMKKVFNQNFSVRQAEVLLHTVRGKTASEIALKLSLSKRTIEYYLLQIKNKMNVSSKSEMINKSIVCLKYFL